MSRMSDYVSRHFYQPRAMRFIAGGAEKKWKEQQKQEIHNSCCEQLFAVNVCFPSARYAGLSGSTAVYLEMP